MLSHFVAHRQVMPPLQPQWVPKQTSAIPVAQTLASRSQTASSTHTFGPKSQTSPAGQQPAAAHPEPPEGITHSGAGTHAPLWQVPVPPSQEMPSATLVCSQVPALQRSSVHSLSSSQSGGAQVAGSHAPFWQVPVPPSQEMPSATLVCSQVPALQRSSVHSLSSSQSGGTQVAARTPRSGRCQSRPRRRCHRRRWCAHRCRRCRGRRCTRCRHRSRGRQVARARTPRSGRCQSRPRRRCHRRRWCAHRCRRCRGRRCTRCRHRSRRRRSTPDTTRRSTRFRSHNSHSQEGAAAPVIDAAALVALGLTRRRRAPGRALAVETALRARQVLPQAPQLLFVVRSVQAPPQQPSPLSHEPQLPPHPSSPQFFPPQLGVQLEPQTSGHHCRRDLCSIWGGRRWLPPGHTSRPAPLGSTGP